MERKKKIIKLKTKKINDTLKSDFDLSEQDSTQISKTFSLPIIEDFFLKTMIHFKTNTFQQDSLFRKKEKEKIKDFIFQNFFDLITNEEKFKFSTMIIFGQPGLGKTLMMHEIMNKLTIKGVNYLETKKNIIPETKIKKKIQCFFINAMLFSNCAEFITSIIYQIKKRCKIKYKKKNDINSLFQLQNFEKSLDFITEHNHIIVMIDELENLLNKDKSNFQVIINFLNINKKNFVKIGISNTLDLFSGVGSNNILHFNFLIFKTYSVTQLQGLMEHITKRSLKNTLFVIEDIFRTLKIFSFIAKKVEKNKSGDMRFALNIIHDLLENKLKEIRENNKNGIVLKEEIVLSIKNVSEVLNAKFDNKDKDIIEKLNFSTQIFLLTIFQIIKENNQKENLDKIKNHFGILLDDFHLSKIKEFSNLNTILECLENYNLISKEVKKRKKIKNVVLISCNISRSELEMYLSNVPGFKNYFN